MADNKLKFVFMNIYNMKTKVEKGNENAVAKELNENILGKDYCVSVEPTKDYKVFKISLYDFFEPSIPNEEIRLELMSEYEEEHGYRGIAEYLDSFYEDIDDKSYYGKEIDRVWKEFYDTFMDDLVTIIIRMNTLGFSVMLMNMDCSFSDMAYKGIYPYIKLIYMK